MHYEYSLKIILIRPPGIGNIIDKVVKDKFPLNYKQTVGVDILNKKVEFREGKIASLAIWDINTKYLHKSYYHTTDAALIFLISQVERRLKMLRNYI